MQSRCICHVTEVDLDEEVGGAMTNDMKMICALRKLGDVDIIYLQKRKCRSMAAALLLFGIQILRSLSNPYMVYFSRGLFPSFILLLLRPFHGKKLVHQALSVPFPSGDVKYFPHNKLESFVRFCLFRFLERIVPPKVDMITVAAEDYSLPLMKADVKKCNIEVVPFYVEDDFFQQPIKSGADESFKFCYVGLFHLYHGLLPLVEAFELFNPPEKSIKLLLVGDGPQRPRVEREVVRRRLRGKIEFAGIVPHSSLPSFLSKTDCFILFSHASAIPIGLLEAAAAGKAIITLRRKEDGALSRYFRHGKEIYMVNTFSASEIAKALDLLYENSELRYNLAQGARKVAERYFSEDATLHQLRRLIDSL